MVHEKSEGNHNNPQLINPCNACNNLMDSGNNCNINQTRLFYSWNFGTINIRKGKEKSEGSRLYIIVKEVARAKLLFCCLQEVRYRNNGKKSN